MGDDEVVTVRGGQGAEASGGKNGRMRGDAVGEQARSRLVEQSSVGPYDDDLYAGGYKLADDTIDCHIARGGDEGAQIATQAVGDDASYGGRLAGPRRPMYAREMMRAASSGSLRGVE